jgi:hypothetical protein
MSCYETLARELNLAQCNRFQVEFINRNKFRIIYNCTNFLEYYQYDFLKIMKYLRFSVISQSYERHEDLENYVKLRIKENIPGKTSNSRTNEIEAGGNIGIEAGARVDIHSRGRRVSSVETSRDAPESLEGIISEYFVNVSPHFSLLFIDMDKDDVKSFNNLSHKILSSLGNSDNRVLIILVISCYMEIANSIRGWKEYNPAKEILFKLQEIYDKLNTTDTERVSYEAYEKIMRLAKGSTVILMNIFDIIQKDKIQLINSDYINSLDMKLLDRIP